MKIIICMASVIVRAGVRTIIGEHASMRVLGETGNSAEAIRLASSDGADVMIIDDAIARQSGDLEAVEALADRTEAALVALIGDAESAYPNDLLRQGVRGILSPDEPHEHLLDAVQAASGGAIYVSPNFAAAVVDRVAGPTAARPQSLEKLTPRELEVLDHVVLGRSNQEIAVKLTVSEKTVKFHVSSILRKFALRSRAQLIANFANIE
jgi:DNA-binding NarL/FixJ family response regulator